MCGCVFVAATQRCCAPGGGWQTRVEAPKVRLGVGGGGALVHVRPPVHLARGRARGRRRRGPTAHTCAARGQYGGCPKWHCGPRRAAMHTQQPGHNCFWRVPGVTHVCALAGVGVRLGRGELELHGSMCNHVMIAKSSNQSKSIHPLVVVVSHV